MTHFADPAKAGPDAREHQCSDLTGKVRRTATQRSGSACGPDPYLNGGVDLCPGCAAVPLPDPFDLYCPACWAEKGVKR